MQEELLKELIQAVRELNENIKMMNSEVFTAKEGAKYLKIGYDTILREARTGRIDHMKNGTDYLFKKEHLNSWLEKNKARVV